MHPEALAFVARYATGDPVAVLDIGGRDVNGTPRGLFPNATVYRVLDALPGPNVDVVADAASWTPDAVYDVVLATEVFEHTPAWPAICRTAFAALRPGGLFVATMAGPERAVHSGVDGGSSLHPGEHYANIDAERLRAELAAQGWLGLDSIEETRVSPSDVRVAARRPPRGGAACQTS